MCSKAHVEWWAHDDKNVEWVLNCSRLLFNKHLMLCWCVRVCFYFLFGCRWCCWCCCFCIISAMSMLAVWHDAYLGSNKSGSISMGWFKLLHSPPFYISMHLQHIFPHIIAHILYMLQMCLIKVIKIPAIRKCKNCGHFERERRALHSTARLYKLT